ncbi:unnamed protein product [Rotaria sordida]|uniref:WH2 domain-containing protein n=1 Tax=Rotaria sordida TaxID=392033 RepID=A0A814RT82_9BILA|nr:unnamed protein product [Rotaria sordida]CAF3729633.1 unnamed protein product [Rotaria sordida]
MMPIVEQSSVHHHHGHGHQTFYHEQHIPEETNKIQLTLILPNGVPSIINVDANTPMMDLLVQAASLNKLNPSSYSLVVLDSNQHVIHFKANQTVGQIGSSTISLQPKESTHSNSSSKPKTQPFEITVRLQVNLPDAQKILLRIDPTLPLYDIKEQICKQKKYINSNQYTLRLPNKLDQPLLLGLSLAEYKTNELTLIYNKQLEFEQEYNTNQIQSFDRLYRIRSESQPPKENFLHIQQQNEQKLINTKQINRSNTNRSSTLRPSHTTLHAYWNDPNFDTQSQLSTSSSIAKKRRAPRPPGSINSKRPDSQIVYIQEQEQTSNNINSHSLPLHIDHHQSHESLQSENTKKKRKAPIVAPINSVQEKDEIDQIEQKQNLTNSIARPGSDPPPPPSMANTISASTNNLHEDFRPTIEMNQKSIDEPEKNDVTMNQMNENQSVLNSLQNRTSTNDELAIRTNSLEPITIEIHSPSSIHSLEQIQIELPNSIPTIIQQQEEKSEQKEILTSIPSMIETNIIGSSIPKPPRQNIHKEKKSSTINGLLRIVNDHNERSNIYQKNDNQQKETNENVSYFRVAKSRYGKFETDNRGFVNNSIAIFDSTNQQKSEQQINKNSDSSELLTNSKQFKTLPSNIVQHQTKGKQAYNLLKKYEKETQSQSINNADYLKATNQQDKPSMPIQLQVTERTTHITVTVESDRKQLITQTSPVSQESSSPPAPPILAPKPFGKTIAEYRTIRGIGNNDETITPIRNRITSSTDINNKRRTSLDNNKRLSTNLAASHDALMESIRQFGGSQNLRKK